MTSAVFVANVERVGELLISGDRLTELASYFDTNGFRSHGPDGFETDFAGTLDFFKAFRAAFDNRSIRRGITIAEGRHLACQTLI